jgi:hypothetical protein
MFPRNPYSYSLFVVALLLASMAIASEKKIPRSDLPKAVEKTVATESQGAVIRGFSKEQDSGQTYYEAEFLVGRHRRDIRIDAKGAIVEAEEEIATDTLPVAVQAGLRAKAGAGKILGVESITKHDKLVAYEAQVKTHGKRSEVQVAADGRPLDHEE